MYISKDQLDARLAGQNGLKLAKREGLGSANRMAPETKVLAGVLAKFDTQANVAKTLGTTQEHISQLVTGKLGGEELQEKIAEATKNTKEKVSDKALELLVGALEQISDKGHIVKNGVEATIVAKNIASIVEKMTPRGESGNINQGSRIQINIHGTARKDEADYEVIEVPA